jgi:glucokinase
MNIAASSTDDPQPVTIGIDLGGTGTRVIALDTEGVIRNQTTTPTPVRLSPARAVPELVHTVIRMAAGLRLQGVGIGASGPVSPAGIIGNPETLPSYTGVPITKIIGESLDVPCVIDIDAVTAAIGEYRYGAGRGSDALLVITLGTGIGVAILIRGAPLRAADGTHPEAGHISVSGPAAPCYCGLRTCWEQLASRAALGRLTDGRTEEVARRAHRGDPSAAELFNRYGEHVGAGLATLLTIYKPDRVVIGGGAAQYLDLFQAALRQSLKRSVEYAWTPAFLPAQLGNVAGAVGAAVISRPG